MREYLNGQIYAMVGESASHNHLTNNMGSLLRGHLKDSPCDVFQMGFKVKIGTRFFLPDILVRCDTEHDSYTENPTMVVEILSASSVDYDRTFKLVAYKKIPSLIEYVLLDYDERLVEVYQRICTHTWNYTVYTPGDNIHFKSIDLMSSVDLIYKNVNNSDTRKP